MLPEDERESTFGIDIYDRNPKHQKNFLSEDYSRESLVSKDVDIAGSSSLPGSRLKRQLHGGSEVVEKDVKNPSSTSPTASLLPRIAVEENSIVFMELNQGFEFEQTYDEDGPFSYSVVNDLQSLVMQSFENHPTNK